MDCRSQTAISFDYNITDGTGNVAGSATLDITPVNDTPQTTTVFLTPIAEDSGARIITQAELLANATDIEGDTLTATVLSRVMMVHGVTRLPAMMITALDFSIQFLTAQTALLLLHH